MTYNVFGGTLSLTQLQLQRQPVFYTKCTIMLITTEYHRYSAIYTHMRYFQSAILKMTCRHWQHIYTRDECLSADKACCLANSRFPSATATARAVNRITCWKRQPAGLCGATVARNGIHNLLRIEIFWHLILRRKNRGPWAQWEILKWCLHARTLSRALHTCMWYKYAIFGTHV